MLIKRKKSIYGFSLVEVTVAMVILVIASLGTIGYQYQAVRHAQIADAQTIATRTGQLLLEDWKSTGGSSTYDPTLLELGFSAPQSIPSGFGQDQGFDGQEMGSPIRNGLYAITIDNIPMMIMLKWQNVDYDDIARVTLRQLTVIVKFGQLIAQTTDDGGNVSENIIGKQDADLSEAVENVEPVILTTYIRLDASGG